MTLGGTHLFSCGKGKYFTKAKCVCQKQFCPKVYWQVTRMPIRAWIKPNNFCANGSRYLMLGITLYPYLMFVTYWCILVLYVNRLSRVAAAT